MPSDYETITRYNEEQLGKDTASRKSQVNMYSDFSHFVYEILQNADDHDATTITFNLTPEELKIEHNGIPFKEKNVKAISYFGKSTSRDDLIKTGQFGLGFKSVFAFTATPAIYSGEEHFQIYGLYRLKALPRPADFKPEKTRIRLPFNHVEEQPDFVETLVPEEKAFNKISRRLKKLDITALLFTRNLLEIKWTVQDEEGHYLRGDKHKKNISEDFRERKTELTDGDTLHTYLVFSRSIKWRSKEYKPVEIAFFLDDSNKGERIRSTKKPLFILFPTTQETKIGFLINGPFRTPAHRETVSQDDEFNQFLVKKVASLICDALPKIMERGLLTVSLLEALPIRMDDFPEEGMFYPIVEAVRDALMDQELLPANEETFVSARNAKLARRAELRKLLTHDQLRELFQSKDDIRWLSGAITKDLTPDLHSYLMNELDVKEIRPEKFAQLITEDFLQAQTDDWIIEFYNFLGKDNSELWKKPGSVVRQKKILRLENNSHVIPFQPDGKPNAYLPTSSKTKFPTIKRAIFNDKGAEEFLRNLGLIEPGLFAEVIEFVLPKYIDLPSLVDFQDNIEDLKKVNKLINTPFREEAKNSIAKLRILLSKLGIESLLDNFVKNSEELILPLLKKMVLPQFKFFRAVNEDRVKYKSAKDIYLNNADLHMYFENNPTAWFVDKSYPEDLEQLFKELSIGNIPRVKRKNKDDRGYVIIQNYHGRNKRGLNGFDPAIEADGLECAIKHASIEKSLFIWNHIAIPNTDCIRGVVESSSRQTFENSDKEKQTSQKFGQLLIDSPWLPDRQGNFHKPGELELGNLPDSFIPYEKLADLLGMKKDVVAKLIEEAGISQDTLDIAKELERHPELLAEFKRKIQPVTADEGSTEPKTVHVEIDYKNELKNSFNREGQTELQGQITDQGKVTDSKRRREKSCGDHHERLQNEPSADERRKKTIRTILEGPDEQVREYLSQMYGGKCQICGKTFPERAGNPFFVANYIVPRKVARYADTSANALCLCADHFAKWQHGAIEAENILKQIDIFKTESEGGDGKPMLNIKLCGEECNIYFKEKHLLDLQELLRSSKSDNHGQE